MKRFVKRVYVSILILVHRSFIFFFYREMKMKRKETEIDVTDRKVEKLQALIPFSRISRNSFKDSWRIIFRESFENNLRIRPLKLFKIYPVRFADIFKRNYRKTFDKHFEIFDFDQLAFRTD